MRATVLAYAAAFPSTASALVAATADTPVPDLALSTGLVALRPRLQAVAALQRAQAAEVAALRARGEKVLRAWYAGRVLRYGSFVAKVEGRVEGLEALVRRKEKASTREKEEEKAGTREGEEEKASTGEAEKASTREEEVEKAST